MKKIVSLAIQFMFTIAKEFCYHSIRILFTTAKVLLYYIVNEFFLV